MVMQNQVFDPGVSLCLEILKGDFGHYHDYTTCIMLKLFQFCKNDDLEKRAFTNSSCKDVFVFQVFGRVVLNSWMVCMAKLTAIYLKNIFFLNYENIGNSTWFTRELLRYLTTTPLQMFC